VHALVRGGLVHVAFDVVSLGLVLADVAALVRVGLEVVFRRPGVRLAAMQARQKRRRSLAAWHGMSAYRGQVLK
jgi:hypothetical protein